MNKNRQIISELKDFFKHNDSSKAVNAVNNVMDKLVIQAKTVGPVKNPNWKFTFVQLVKLHVLLPFFSVKTAADYADSAQDKLLHSAFILVLILDLTERMLALVVPRKRAMSAVSKPSS